MLAMPTIPAWAAGSDFHGQCQIVPETPGPASFVQ